MYPLSPRLRQAGILTESQVHQYLGMRDRLSVADSLVDVLADGPPHFLANFCDVMAKAGVAPEILEVRVDSHIFS